MTSTYSQLPESTKVKLRANARNFHQRHPEYKREWVLKLKTGMVAAYGGSCKCCGESHIEFLTIDHPNGDGKEYRLKVGGGGERTWSDLRRRGWPQDGFRLFCANCNLATMFGRKCPHELEATTT